MEIVEKNEFCWNFNCLLKRYDIDKKQMEKDVLTKIKQINTKRKSLNIYIHTPVVWAAFLRIL